MSSIKLSIAEIVKNFNEDVGKYDDILDAFYKNSMPLCEHIRSILQSKEDLKVAYSDLPDSTTILLADPKTMNYSKELIAWSIAILAASWAEWFLLQSRMMTLCIKQILLTKTILKERLQK